MQYSYQSSRRFHAPARSLEAPRSGRVFPPMHCLQDSCLLAFTIAQWQVRISLDGRLNPRALAAMRRRYRRWPPTPAPHQLPIHISGQGPWTVTTGGLKIQTSDAASSLLASVDHLVRHTITAQPCSLSRSWARHIRA